MLTHGAVAVVTRAGSGIGRGFGVELARRGARVSAPILIRDGLRRPLDLSSKLVVKVRTLPVMAGRENGAQELYRWAWCHRVGRAVNSHRAI